MGGAAAVRPRWPTLLVLTLLAAAVAADAVGIPVLENGALQALYAERATTEEGLHVTATEISLSPQALPPQGTARSPVELTEVPSAASTPVAPRHWTYSATVTETSALSVSFGLFGIELLVNGASAGLVHVKQEVNNPTAPEGVRVTFDVGAERLESPLFVVKIHLLTPPEESYHVRSVPVGLNEARWRGVGGTIDGKDNPLLRGKVGTPIAITASNGDNGFHRLVVTDENANVVAGPTQDLLTAGDSATVTFTPASAGSYTYLCDYHPGTMIGKLKVAP